MLTIFTIPKPFKGHTDIIQRNAINSWLRLKPKLEVILLGDDEGISEVSNEYDVKHISKIKKSEFGTPRIDCAFKLAESVATYNTMCFINSDIILNDEFPKAIKDINNKFSIYLASGLRWDLDIQQLFDYSNNNWKNVIKMKINPATQTPQPGGMDYFVFPKYTLKSLPPFIVGRSGWDNWLIYYARSCAIPMIDMTKRIQVIHQNHSYNHIPKKQGNKWEGPESDYNLELAGKKHIYLWNLDDADWEFSTQGLHKRPLSIRQLYQSLIIYSPRFIHPLLEQAFLFQNSFRYR